MTHPVSLTIEQALDQAVSHRQAGQLQDAEHLYRAILQAQPNHPDANHNLGVLAVQVKQPAAGLPYLKSALEADPSQGHYWISYIDALLQADRFETAREMLTLAKQQGLQEDQLEALAVRLENVNDRSNLEYQHTAKEPPPVTSAILQNSKQKQKTRPTKPDKSLKTPLHQKKNPSNQEINALVALFNEGRYAEAATLAQSLTERFPLHGFGWKALGALFKQLGRGEDALIAMQKAAALLPNDAEVHYNLGNTLKYLGRLSDAETSYRQALNIKPTFAEAHYNLGNILKDTERLDEAKVRYQQALAIKPDYADAYYNLGGTLQELGRLDEAEAGFRRALEINRDYAEAHCNLGNTLMAQGRLDEAEASFRRALEINPSFTEAHYNLGNIFKDSGRLEEAELSYRRALEIKPDFAEAHSNLGNTLKDRNRLDEAEASYRRALEIKPDFAEAHCNLGNTLKDLDRLNEAQASCLRALEIKPNYAEAYYNLGNILKKMDRLNEAEASYRQALEITPDIAEAYYNLAGTLHELDRLNEAEACFRQALQIKPDYAEAHCDLGFTLNAQGRLDDASASYLRALTVKPDYALASIYMGFTMQKCGQLDDAVAYFRHALEIESDNVVAHSCLIFTLELMTSETPSSLQKERKRWDAAHAAHLHQQLPHSNIPDPERRLRIGYVSADFKDHSAPRAFGGMLTCYDRSQFEVFAYSNLRGKSDRFTELFKQNATVWRDIAGLSDDAVAKMIREDQIDILIDLSAHMAGNRLLVFARKPAPIQITAWGNATSTGMQAMDVFFTDPVMVPPEDKPYFAEEVRYLPNAMGSFFMDQFPEINKLPALSNGIVTFGSLNRLTKLSDKVYDAWAQVLLAVPQSRLILKSAELDNVAIRERVTSYFTIAGVAADRITLLGTSSWYEHLQIYHQIDIALDPFPQGGGVTALEGLMMGVPVISLCGSTAAGRVSASIMTTLELTDWIAKNHEKYIKLAIQKTTDLQSLAALRQQLRSIFSSSVLGDQTAYARAVEQEYRKLWQEWCSRV